jgi:4-hydroxybenzoate polyprenyltransferase
MTNRAPSFEESGGATLPDTSAPWLLRVLPRRWRPFLQLARIDRPIGWQLLLLPCWWSAALAADVAGTIPNLAHLVLFLIGAVAMRGAGCTFNDIVDRDIDRKVERTRERPVASGRISVGSAALLLGLQATIGAVVLFSLNRFSIGLGLASLIVVAIYPFAKRVTNWPQAVLGLAFAWGGLMGWSALFGSLSWAPVLLYFAAVLWTIGYDTIYALQDTTDDAVVGIGSTALFFGESVRSGVAVIYALAIALAWAAFAAAEVGWIAYAGLLGFAIHCAWQVHRIDRESASLSLALFRSNRIAGLVLFAGLVLDTLIRHHIFL